MHQSIRAGAATHRLIDDAPYEAVVSLLASQAPELIMPERRPGEEAAMRDEILCACARLPRLAARRLDDLAVRILSLAEHDGPRTLSRVIKSEANPEARREAQAQSDAHGRSIWCYLYQPRLFEAAEALAYATHFRDFGKIYGAFDMPAPIAFEWSDGMAAELQARVEAELRLDGPIALTHLYLDGTDELPASHLLILRHAGDPSSVAEHLSDGARGFHYYQPPNEIVLVYSQARGLVEVCADSPAIRHDFATIFAEVGLRQDLSHKPLSFRIYNLSRFRGSLRLPSFQPEGHRVGQARVVEVEVTPLAPTRRLSLKVATTEDIEEVQQAIFPGGSPFRNTPVTRVTIAVEYWGGAGKPRKKVLNITLSRPNRCNLASKKDPRLRELGYALLEHWGVMRTLEPLRELDERALLPALLWIYDANRNELTELDLLEEGIDARRLVDHAFLEPAGLYETMVIDEDDHGPEITEPRPGMAGGVEYEDASGATAWRPGNDLIKYRPNLPWIEDLISRRLAPFLGVRAVTRPIPELVTLGEISLGSESVVCHLARGLHDPKVLARVDDYLRGRAEQGIGLVLAAGHAVPVALGPNVVLSLRDYLSADEHEGAPRIDALKADFARNRQRARNGLVVDFVKNAHAGALYLPGKLPLPVTGAEQIKIIERLVQAHDEGVIVVPTGVLMDGTGSDNPAQAFKAQKSILSNYITSPKKGYWQLALA